MWIKHIPSKISANNCAISARAVKNDLLQLHAKVPLQDILINLFANVFIQLQITGIHSATNDACVLVLSRNVLPFVYCMDDAKVSQNFANPSRDNRRILQNEIFSYSSQSLK